MYQNLIRKDKIRRPNLDFHKLTSVFKKEFTIPNNKE